MSVTRSGGNVFFRLWNALRTIGQRQPAIRSTSDLPATNTGSGEQQTSLLPLQRALGDNRNTSTNHWMDGRTSSLSLFNAAGRYQPFSTLYPRFNLRPSASTVFDPFSSGRTNVTRYRDGSYSASLHPSTSKPFSLQQEYDAASGCYEHDFHSERNSDGLEVHERVSASPNHFCSSQMMTYNNGIDRAVGLHAQFPAIHSAMGIMGPLTGRSSLLVNALQHWFPLPPSASNRSLSTSAPLAALEPSPSITEIVEPEEGKEKAMKTPVYSNNTSSKNTGVESAARKGLGVVSEQLSEDDD